MDRPVNAASSILLRAIAALDATQDEKADLLFWGDWDLAEVTQANVAALVTETLSHLRAENAEKPLNALR